jgi:hypothetical protein
MKMLRRVALVAALFASPFAVLAQEEEPEPAPHGHHHHPPREAIAACEGQAAGANCSFTHHERSLQGTCFTPDSSKPLACRPAGGRRHRE